MANRKLAKEFMSISIINPPSSATNFDVGNILDRSSPQRHWRSVGTTETDIVFDMQTTQTAVTAYLDWCNFTDITYSESANSSGPWTTVSDITVQEDNMHGVYRNTNTLALSNKQFLRLRINGAQSTTDGANYFRIGTFAIPTNIVELDAETTVEYPYDVTLPSSHIIENRFPTGKTEKIKLGRLQPMVISFALRTGVHQNIKGQGVQEISDLLRDPTETIFLDFNLGQSWQAYLVKKSGDLRASLNSPATGTADFGSVLFDVIT